MTLPILIDKGRDELCYLLLLTPGQGAYSGQAYSSVFRTYSWDTILNFELGLDLELSMVSQELIEKGIRVNMIAPGFVLTGDTPYAPPHVQDAIAKATPLGRLATPDDIAKGVLFLASDLSRFITGQSLVIDGGYSLSGKPF